MRASTFKNNGALRYVTFALAMLSFSSAMAGTNTADLILLSNHVITMTQDDQRQARPLAIAVRGEQIVGISSHAASAQWQSAHTRVLDLGDQAILPGFIDAHGHIVFSSLATILANVASPPVGPAQNIQQLQAALTQYISKNQTPKGEWVVGMGYDDSLLAEQRHPNRHDLDQVSRVHPIMLLHVSGHLIAANSLALNIGGINADTEDPAGGIIRRVNGVPDGVLEETATYPLRAFMTAPNKDPIQSLQTALTDYAARGITTVQDGASNSVSIELLRQAARQNALNLDVIAFPVGQPDPQTIIDEYPFGTYEGRLKIGGIKLILDGSPQGKTAYLSEPYLHPPHGQPSEYRGYPTLPDAQVFELVQTYLQAGIPMLAHANGDAAAEVLIQAMTEATESLDQPMDHRAVMIHAQTVRDDQLDRMHALGMIPSFFSAHAFYWGDWHRDSVFGVPRATRISPTASAVARNMRFTTHNDAPIVPPDMLRLIWATTNRLTRSGQVLGKQQRISIYDALASVTTHAAYQNFEEQVKGQLTVGRLADLVVLSANPLQQPIEQLLALRVEATFSRGVQVFSRAHPR